MTPRGGGHSRARYRAKDVGSSSQSNNVDGSSSHSHSTDTISSNDICTPIEVSNRCLTPSNEISHKLKMIFEQIPCPEGYTWTRVPEEHKDSWFREFEKYFSWDNYSEECIRELWNGHASDKYKGWVHRLKTSGKQPKFVSDADWQLWLTYWSSDEFKKNLRLPRRIGCQNRMVLVPVSASISVGHEVPKNMPFSWLKSGESQGPRWDCTMFSEDFTILKELLRVKGLFALRETFNNRCNV